MKVILIGKESQREIKEVLKALKKLDCEVILVTDESRELRERVDLIKQLEQKLVIQPIIDSEDHLILRKTKSKFHS